MPATLKLLLTLVIVCGIAAWGYLTLLRQPVNDDANPAQSPSPEHPLATLAEHHCNRLKPESEVARCKSQIQEDLQAGQLQPVTPDVNPLACNGIADREKQHACHGRMGHDFAVSTGDSSHCDVIPQDDIRASCRRLIVINEIKALYALESES
ncbi:MAG: hypothetical protein R3208_19090 [Ketobacteraceae bacterium]|nr:hypothetical protein [Ketobacteraceae bacterium]